MEYLTVIQAGELLGMTRQSVVTAIRQGRLPASRFGRAWQIRRVDVEAYKLTPKHWGGRPRKTPPAP